MASADYVRSLAMNIVNQLFDLADVPVEKRQSINDEADAFVCGLLSVHSDSSGDVSFAKWEIVDAHRCTVCGHLDTDGHRMVAHLRTHGPLEHEAPAGTRTPYNRTNPLPAPIDGSGAAK